MLIFFRSTSVRTMSVLNSRAGSPHTGTLNSHFTCAASSGSVTLDRLQRGDFVTYSPNLSSLAARNPVYTGFDGQSYRLPSSVGEQWSLSRNGPKPTTSNHRGLLHFSSHDTHTLGLIKASAHGGRVVGHPPITTNSSNNVHILWPKQS